MGRHGQLIAGPAGAGKSTYCEVLQKHCENAKRSVSIVNLDPAAEAFNYDVAFDIRELITIEDVMEELGFGPNGALVYCMEFLIQNSDWLLEKLGDFNDDYLIFDLPGQIELYSHIGVMVSLIKILENEGLCAVYLLDSHFLDDPGKFVAGSLQTLSAMIHLSLPHVNVITKMDLLPDEADELPFFEKYFQADIPLIINDLNKKTPKRYHQLASCISTVVEEYNLISYLPLNVNDPDSIERILQIIDQAIQYGEDLEPREPKDDDTTFGD